MNKKKARAGFFVVALLISIGVAFFLSPLASPDPDGLEKVAETLGFDQAQRDGAWHFAPMPEYSFGESTVLSGMVAGVVGTILVFLFGFGIGFLIQKRNHRER